MTAPTPESPLDVEALRKRRQDAEQHVRDLGDRLPRALAALDEASGRG